MVFYGRNRRFRRQTFRRKLPHFGLSRRDARYVRGAYRSNPTYASTYRKTMHSPITKLVNIYKQSLPFPQIYTVKQSYSEILNMTVGAVGKMGTEKVFSLNDMYDPDYSSPGHQPYARDTMASLYEKYKVLGCWVDITFYGADTNSIAVACGLSHPGSLSNGVIQGLSTPQVAERNNAEVKFLSSNGNQKQTFRFYVSMAKLFQISKLQFKADVDRYSAQSNYSPTHLGFCRVAIADTKEGSTATANCSVKLTYLTTWYQRKTLPTS